MAELNLELWIGDAGEIRSKPVRRQKTDREDARLILRLLLEVVFHGSGCRVVKIGIYGN